MKVIAIPSSILGPLLCISRKVSTIICAEFLHLLIPSWPFQTAAAILLGASFVASRLVFSVARYRVLACQFKLLLLSLDLNTGCQFTLPLEQFSDINMMWVAICLRKLTARWSFHCSCSTRSFFCKVMSTVVVWQGFVSGTPALLLGPCRSAGPRHGRRHGCLLTMFSTFTSGFKASVPVQSSCRTWLPGCSGPSAFFLTGIW
jgi:hypothetical protein